MNTPQKKSQLTPLLVVLIVLISVIAAVGATYYLRGNYLNASAGNKTVNAPAEKPIFVALEPFTVNLRPDDRSRFLHIGITLKVTDVKSQARLTEYLPESRSRILTLLSNRDSALLVTAEDKRKLATEILETLNKPLVANQPAQRISNVLFTAFVVQ